MRSHGRYVVVVEEEEEEEDTGKVFFLAFCENRVLGMKACWDLHV